MPELMHGNTKPSRLLNPVDNLGAEGDLFLVLAGHAGKQTVRVSAAHQRGTEIVHIFIDDCCYLLVEFKSEWDLVLHVISAERQPIVGVGPAGFRKVLVKTNGGEIAQPHR